MITHHPGARTLERFLDDLLGESECHAIERHLLICSSCEERLIGLLPERNVPFASVLDGKAPSNLPAVREAVLFPDFGAAVAHQGGRIEEQRLRAPALWSELAALAPETRRFWVEQDRRFHTWALCELLLERSQALAPSEPAEALAAAEMALAIALRLPLGELPQAAIASAQTRAWGHLGNARRIFADYREAERCFEKAERRLGESWLDPLDEGQLLQFQASLDRDLGRLNAAVERLETALEIYRGVNEPHQQGRCWISLGVLFYLLDELNTSEECLHQGASLIDPKRDRRLRVCAHQYLVLGRLKAGRAAEALTLLRNEPVSAESGGTELDWLRERWLEAQILGSLNRLVEAQELLVEVHAGFTAARLPYDAALAGLELAQVYARRGLAGNARRMAERTLPIFRSLDTRPAFVAAVIVFESVLAHDRLNLTDLREIYEAIERARAGEPADQPFLPASNPARAVSGAAQSAAFKRPISLPFK